MTTPKRACVTLLALAAGVALCGCDRAASGKKGDLTLGGDSANTSAKPVRFTEIAKSAGIDFVHENGARGRKLMPETVGSGVAFLDYDGDGHQDILILNGRSWPNDPKPVASTPHLYKNKGDGTFSDATVDAGLSVSLYGMGVAVGDYDNDGKPDLYLTAVGKNYLFHNDGGKFTDVTQTAGVVGVPLSGTKMEHKWSASTAWLDYDRDGKLDLFVTQYVKWSPEIDPFCGKNGVRGYCPPGNFEGARCTLFHNDGGGKFSDVSEKMGILDGAIGKSFGIAVADYNNDGWPDIAVSNDTWANFLLVNEGGKRFVDKGVESGIAFSESGRAKAGMGIDVADYRNDNTWNLVIGNFAEEGLSLFEPVKDVPGMFEDRSQERGIANASLLNVTFATFFFDYDLDGWLDILATNGHVDDIVNTYKSDLAFRQKPLLFHNERGGTRFVDVTDSSGLAVKLVGRGAAFGDIDNDGDLDIGIVDNGGRFLLLRNDGGNQNRWIRLKLVGTRVNRDAIGAVVRVKTGGVTQRQLVRSGGSFLSESQRELTFGLGGNVAADEISVVWPDGSTETFGPRDAGREHVLTQGQGKK